MLEVCNGWEDLMEDWGWEVVSLLMSGPRLQGSVPRKWAIKIEDLFIFLLPLFLLCIWHGEQKSGRLLGNDLGRQDESPHGGPACESEFINGNTASIIMVLLFNQQYLGGGLDVLNASDLPRQ